MARGETVSAMRVADALVAGLSPVLQFLLQQEFSDFKDDLLSLMFEHPPPYTNMAQLLQGLDLRVRCANKLP